MNHRQLDKLFRTALKSIEGIRKIIGEAEDVTVASTTSKNGDSSEEIVHHPNIQTGRKPKKTVRFKSPEPSATYCKSKAAALLERSEDSDEMVPANREVSPTLQAPVPAAQEQQQVAARRSICRKAPLPSYSAATSAKSRPKKKRVPEPVSSVVTLADSTAIMSAPQKQLAEHNEDLYDQQSNANLEQIEIKSVDQPASSLQENDLRLRKRKSTDFSWRYLDEYKKIFPEYHQDESKSKLNYQNQAVQGFQAKLMGWVQKHYNLEDKVHLERLAKRASQLAREFRVPMNRRWLSAFIKENIRGRYKLVNSKMQSVRM